MTRAYVTKTIHLAFLTPDILDRCMRGDHPLELNARRLTRMGPLPLDWDAQHKQLGMMQ